MSKKVQYQQNIDIINKFFKKPVTLITGILSILSAFSFSVAFYYGSQLANNIINDALKQIDYLNKGQTFHLIPSILINLFPVFFGISFIILHFFSEDDGNKTHSVSKFFKITSLIKVILSIFATLGILCISISTVFVFNNITTVVICCSFLIASVLFVIMNFSRYGFAKSIHSSVNSIYLNKNSSTLFGVLNFICGFFSLLILLFIVYTSFVGFHLITLVPFIVFFVLLTAEKLFWGLTSVMYSRYVQGIIYGKVKITDIPPMSDFEKRVTEEFLAEELSITEPAINLKPKNTMEFPKKTEVEVPVADFVFPQEAVKISEPKTVPTVIIHPTDTFTPVAAPKPEPEADINVTLEKLKIQNETNSLFSCPDCGTPFTEEDFFCSVCGKKLI